MAYYKIELKSGAIGTRWQATLRRLSRTFVPVTLFVRSAKWSTP